jgi:hypothetical protein
MPDATPPLAAGLSPANRARLRTHDAARMAAALEMARKALETATTTWGLWADDVRADVEARLGRVYEPDDPVLLVNPEFGTALDVGGAIDELSAQLASVTEKFARAESGQTATTTRGNSQ